ncbi:MAG: alanine racemase [Lachnospiraceae bacterium]|nr:alanine racemase [Lachnospiraceae bacterium]
MENEAESRLATYMRGYVEVNLDNIVDNIKNMNANTAPDTKLTAVIKADGYGHGSIPIARALEPFDFMYGFAVATAEEAHILRRAGIKKPILILGYTFPYCYEQLLKEDIRPAVFRYDMIDELSQAAKKTGIKARVHIKLDTGMGRIGVTPDGEGLKFVSRLAETEGIEIEGIFTHFARADEHDKTDAMRQLAVFNNFIDMIKERLGLELPVRHCSNSAGILELREANMDMVRAGITLYGLYPSEEVSREVLPLKPALSLYSHVVYVKTIHAGQSVSYGGTFTAVNDTRVATIPLGYADGYPRSLSGKGYVLIHGRRARILGRVCMAQFMVDVTDIPDVRENDRVTLIGFDGDEHISAEFLGDMSGRFNYELVCDLNKRLPRVYIYGGKCNYVKDYFDDYK